MSGESAIPIGNLIGVLVLSSWKDDGADSGCISIQSNGVVANV